MVLELGQLKLLISNFMRVGMPFVRCIISILSSKSQCLVNANGFSTLRCLMKMIASLSSNGLPQICSGKTSILHQVCFCTFSGQNLRGALTTNSLLHFYSFSYVWSMCFIKSRCRFLFCNKFTYCLFAITCCKAPDYAEIWILVSSRARTSLGNYQI